MRYQLVIQFPEDSIKYEGMVELEEVLIARLGDQCQIDGHDIGSGQVNIFILTDKPREVFEAVKGVVSGDHLSAMKVAYRRLDGDKYSILWPAGEETFEIK